MSAAGWMACDPIERDGVVNHDVWGYWMPPVPPGMEHLPRVEGRPVLVCAVIGHMSNDGHCIYCGQMEEEA